jgi:hypothetical protein
MLKYIKYRQKQLEKKWTRAAELEAEKEARKEAELEAEARMQEEIATRKRILLEQQETKRIRQKHAQIKEKLTEQKWNNQVDTLLAQVEDCLQEDNKLEEIRFIIQNREPFIQELDWVSWLSDPLNQRLADLDFSHAMEMFKRDNLLAKRRSKTRGRAGKKLATNYTLSFTGNTGASGAEDYVTTDFNPDDYNLNLGFTVSYWVRPDAVGNTMFAFGRKHSNTQRFVFGISTSTKIYIGTGANKLEGRWDSGLADNASGQTAAELFPSLFDDGDLKTGNWLHFVVTYADRDSTSEGSVARKVYLNGELIRSQNVNWSNTGGGTGGMYFGGRNLGGTGYNNGWACDLDEVAIYDTARNAAWVSNVYASGAGFDHTGASNLVGYWKFNEGGGTTVKDHSGNGNHGTFAAISGDTTAYPTWGKR